MTFLEKLNAILENNWCPMQGEAMLLLKSRREFSEDKFPWQLKALIDKRYEQKRGEYGEASAKDALDRDVPMVVI
jgi:hypothetical protein